MRMNSGIILQGQQPDIVGSAARGFEAGRRNRLADIYNQHGAGIAGGDQNAMNALAQFDPTTAMEAQRGHQIMQHADAQEGRTAQTFEMQLDEYARGLDAAEAARQAQKIEQGLVKATQLYHAGDLRGVNMLLAEAGEKPISDLQQFPAIAAQYEKAFTVLKNVRDFNAPDRPEYKVVDGKLVNLSAEGGPATVDLGGNDAPKVDFDTEQKLRKEFSALPAVKAFSSVNDSWDRIQASANDPSAAGDLALIFNYMKMLDPGSVVRESEFATAANAGGVDDRIRNTYNRLLEGERLAPEQRADFLKRAGELFNAQAGNYNDRAEQYQKLAESYSLDPSRIAEVVELYKVEPEEAALALTNAVGPQEPIPEGFPGTGEEWLYMTPDERAAFK